MSGHSIDERDLRTVRADVQAKWTSSASPVRHIDPLVVVAALLLTVLGLVFIYSATHGRLPPGEERAFVERQSLSFVVGVATMVAATLFDYRYVRAWAPVLYLGSLAALALVLVVGVERNGATAWIVVGGFQFQPSEFAKVGLIVALAALYHERLEDGLGLRALVEGVVLAALPMGLILLQPDFGTFMVFVALTAGVLLLARVRVRYLVALVLLGLVAIWGAWHLDLVKDYQIDRLTAFLDLDAADAQGAGWNVVQAQIAVGSGQVTGQGLFRGTQAGLGYVPENHTDFIFTVIGEETGFVGAVTVLAAFALLISRGLRIAVMARDDFGTLLAGGVTAVLAFQLFINVGMTVGIMPVTGLPLPFISYGGTSLMASWIMIGLLQNVHMRRFQ